MTIKTENIAEKFASFSDHWNPRIVGELNGQLLKAAKLKGEFIVHKHDNEDEMFLVIKGKLLIELEDKTLEINPGEYAIIPKGVMHKPIANEEVEVLLFEPASTINTGEIVNERTKNNLEKI